MRDPLWGSVGSWEEERPKPLDPVFVAELLVEQPPHHGLPGFLAGVVQGVALSYRRDDPVEEFARVLSVARYRGRHVLIEIAGWSLFHACTLDGAGFARHLEGARAALAVDDPTAADLLERLATLAEAVDARERGELTADQVLLCARLLDPRAPEVADLPDLSPELDEALRELAARLAGLNAPALRAVVDRRLRRWQPVGVR